MKKTALLLTGLTLLAFMPNARAEIASKAYVDAELEGKMDTMTVDSTPTYNSSNLVSSGGVKTYVDNLETGVYGIAFGGVPGTGNVNSDIAEVSSAGGLKAYVDDVHDYASNINTGIYTLSFGGMPGTGNVNSDIAEVSSAGGFKAYVDAATADISDKLDTDDFNITIYGSTSPASVDVGDIEDYGGLKAYVDAAVSDAGGSVDGLRDDFNITMYGSTDPDSGDQADVANAGGFKAYIDADKLDADGWIPGIMQVSNGSDTPSTIPGINASHIVSEGISIDRINLPPVPSACSANGGSCVLMYVGGQGYTWEIMSRGSNESAPSTNFDGTLYRQGAEVAPAYPQVVGPIN